MLFKVDPGRSAVSTVFEMKPTPSSTSRSTSTQFPTRLQSCKSTYIFYIFILSYPYISVIHYILNFDCDYLVIRNDKCPQCTVTYVDFCFVLDFAVSVPLAPVTTVRNGTTSFSFHCEFVFLNQTAMNGETEVISEWMYNNESISENNTNNKR